MAKKKLYKCKICKKVVEMVYPMSPPTVCCNEPMSELVPKTQDGVEKHVPYIERKDDGVLVKVGRDEKHPMNKDHYIVYIEILADGVLMRQYLDPDGEPEAFFKTDAKDIVAWEFCNIHDLWTSG
ncbi:MAG: desulfoferrodoxin [Euryarchaeota archaeon]|jgi:superoxide reductase|nr:desulfoferrodoxin [Euryarchaeota archaeon]